MKKLIVMAAVAAAMSLTACSGSKTETAEEEEIEFTTPEAVVSAFTEKMKSGDAYTISEAVKTVQEELLEIIDDGDMKKAQAYAIQLETFMNENAEQFEQLNIDTYTLNNTINTLLSIPNAAGQSIKSAAKAAEAEAQAAKDAAVEAAKAQADAAVEAGKAKVNEAVEEGKAKANEAVEEGKAKANEAVQDAADKANKAASDAINDAVNKIKL